MDSLEADFFNGLASGRTRAEAARVAADMNAFDLGDGPGAAEALADALLDEPRLVAIARAGAANLDAVSLGLPAPELASAANRPAPAGAAIESARGRWGAAVLLLARSSGATGTLRAKPVTRRRHPQSHFDFVAVQKIVLDTKSSP